MRQDTGYRLAQHCQVTRGWKGLARGRVGEVAADEIGILRKVLWPRIDVLPVFFDDAVELVEVAKNRVVESQQSPIWLQCVAQADVKRRSRSLWNMRKDSGPTDHVLFSLNPVARPRSQMSA